MSKLRRVQKIGIVILIFSFLAGAIGTVWSIYSSFAALDAAGLDGIGPVGNQIRNALWFSVGGVAGSIVGALMIVFGRSKSVTDRHTKAGL